MRLRAHPVSALAPVAACMFANASCFVLCLTPIARAFSKVIHSSVDDEINIETQKGST